MQTKIVYRIENPEDKDGMWYTKEGILKKKIDLFEAERGAINTLRFGSGLLTDSMIDKIFPKLHKKIVAHVALKNKMKTNK